MVPRELLIVEPQLKAYVRRPDEHANLVLHLEVVLPQRPEALVLLGELPLVGGREVRRDLAEDAGVVVHLIREPGRIEAAFDDACGERAAWVARRDLLDEVVHDGLVDGDGLALFYCVVSGHGWGSSACVRNHINS